MDEVFKKTRELGEAIMKSDEYATMKAAEDVAMRNELAALTMTQYLEKKQALEALMMEDGPDVLKMKALSTEVELINDKLQSIDAIAALTAARADFSQLIAQVNQTLRFIITGEMGEGGGGCGHDCSECSGCRTVH